MKADSSQILVVDDDRDIRSLLAEHLEQAGYRVSTAADGAEMRLRLSRSDVDLIILDLNLPKEDGLSLCRSLRAPSNVARGTTPVIMLTARGDPIDRILGLEMGADDYLAKPFEPRELLARIRNVLKRGYALPDALEPPAFRRAMFAGWTFDAQQRHLVDPSGRVLMLSGAEYRLLRVLVQHAEQVLDRDQLLALGAVRQSDALDRAVDLQVSRLRQKLNEDSRAPQLIKTIRSEGYVLAAAVTFE